MFVKDVKVENQVGLHARPATFFMRRIPTSLLIGFIKIRSSFLVQYEKNV